MTTQEFSEQFDTLYNQQYYMMFSVQNPLALDEYEKSLYLTKAQENIVETLYRAGYGIPEGFEKTEYARRILAPLVLNIDGWEAIPENMTSKDPNYVPDPDMLNYVTNIVPKIKTTANSYIFLIPDPGMYDDNLLLGIYGIIYEQATFGGEDACASGRVADIVPVKHDELHRILRNPFRGASLRRVLRVDHSGEFFDINGEENTNTPPPYRLFYSVMRTVLPEWHGYAIELISKYPIARYFARVIRKPYPIILVSLDDDSPSIEGFKNKMECELNPAVHKTILEEAVKLALASKTLNTIPVAPQPKENKGKDAGE